MKPADTKTASIRRNVEGVKGLKAASRIGRTPRHKGKGKTPTLPHRVGNDKIWRPKKPQPCTSEWERGGHEERGVEDNRDPAITGDKIQTGDKGKEGGVSDFDVKEWKRSGIRAGVSHPAEPKTSLETGGRKQRWGA